jgi:tetratricopeptide (TPR) repeat protein
MLWRYSQHLFHSYAALRLARGEIDAARAYADECLYRAEATDSPKNIVKATRLRAEVFLARGEYSQARAELEGALEVARRPGNPPQLWKTLATLAELDQAEQHLTAARHAAREALEIVGRVAGKLTDVRLRETFVSSPRIQHIRQLAGVASAGSRS